MADPLVMTATCSEPFSALRRVQVKLNDEQGHSGNVRKVTEFVRTCGVTSFDVVRVDSCTVDVVSLVRARELSYDYFSSLMFAIFQEKDHHTIRHALKKGRKSMEVQHGP